MRDAVLLLLAILLAAPAAARAAEPKPQVGDLVNNPPYAHWSAFKPGTSVTQREVVTEKVWTARDIPGGIIKRTVTRKQGDTVASDSVLELVGYK